MKNIVIVLHIHSVCQTYMYTLSIPDIHVYTQYARHTCIHSVCQTYMYTLSMTDIHVHTQYARHTCIHSVCQTYMYTLSMPDIHIYTQYDRHTCIHSVCQTYMYTLSMPDIHVDVQCYYTHYCGDGTNKFLCKAIQARCTFRRGTYRTCSPSKIITAVVN